MSEFFYKLLHNTRFNKEGFDIYGGTKLREKITPNKFKLHEILKSNSDLNN